jgi:hypothetical protein
MFGGLQDSYSPCKVGLCLGGGRGRGLRSLRSKRSILIREITHEGEQGSGNGMFRRDVMVAIGCAAPIILVYPF